jgi:APA family basic amino acid/polyamine antiporter
VLLLLAVFAVVNATVLVLCSDGVEHKHVGAGPVLPVIGALPCIHLLLPWTSGRAVEQYEIAGVLLLGVVLCVITWVVGRRGGGNSARRREFGATDDLGRRLGAR